MFLRLDKLEHTPELVCVREGFADSLECSLNDLKKDFCRALSN